MAHPKCEMAGVLHEVERETEPSIFRALRKTGGEVEAVLVLYCRNCDCFHASILHARAGEDDADRQAFAAVASSLRLIYESIEKRKQEPHGQNHAEETDDRETLN